MMDVETHPSKPRRTAKGEQISELRRKIDQRDETIRLLNEAMSHALDERGRDNRAAA